MGKRISILVLCWDFMLFLMIKDVMGKTCVKKNSCKCELDDGTVIDLSPLANSNGPKFKDVTDASNQDSFSYNPCKAFSEGTCNNVAVCQMRSDTGTTYYYNAGTQESAEFVWDDSNSLFDLTYDADTFYYTNDNRTNAKDNYVLRASVVKLICNEAKEAAFTAVGEIITSNYVFVLESKYACPRSGGGLSAGTILIIIFFTVLVVYLVGGVIFQIFVRKNSGKKVIPNYEFWSEFPSLVKDGVFFIIRRGKGKGNYSSV